MSTREEMASGVRECVTSRQVMCMFEGGISQMSDLLWINIRRHTTRRQQTIGHRFFCLARSAGGILQEAKEEAGDLTGHQSFDLLLEP